MSAPAVLLLVVGEIPVNSLEAESIVRVATPTAEHYVIDRLRAVVRSL